MKSSTKTNPKLKYSTLQVKSDLRKELRIISIKRNKQIREIVNEALEEYVNNYKNNHENKS